ncbi:MAG: hypothetical protein LKF82_08595 [Acinetobacter populi]|jgi:hypothetical protein|uniref:hypothetical protein n=1 Tax=Acinetobacter populi TaxID=1582270 RepID=UPI0023554683|nr:hypothetical protein [Acinetobacter populi]MCH4247882.1 hypothetical protein [Acinetobacter populi]
MIQTLKVAIFGLNLNASDSDKLKEQIFSCFPKNIDIRWVTISEQNIDILFVNEVFFSSPGIQKVLVDKVKHHLKIKKSNKGDNQILNEQCYYPLTDLTYLRKWILQEVLSEYMAINDVDKNKMYDTRSNRESQTQQNLFISSQHVAIQDVFNEIFTPRNGFIKLFDQTGFLALIDAQTERVWLNELDEVTLSEGLNQTYATAQFVSEAIVGKNVYDLKVWLWQLLSHLQLDRLPKTQLSQNFKLIMWPQFEQDVRRRDFLKMSACFAQGANLLDVKQYLNLSDETVLHFVSCANLLKFGHFIDQHDIRFISNREISGSGQFGKVRNFFGKLRKKLGL